MPLEKPRSKIPSLGDGKPVGFKLQTETRELPSSRKALLQEIGAILELGKVQKLTLELGQPITFSRYVEKPEEDPTEERPEDPFELMSAFPIEEYAPETPFALGDLLFRAFDIVSQSGYQPESFFVSSLEPLKKGFGVEAAWNMDKLFGLPVVRTDHIPANVLVLTGSKDESKYSLRMLIPEKK